MVDLLQASASPASLRDCAGPNALARLATRQLTGAEDIYEVLPYSRQPALWLGDTWEWTPAGRPLRATV